MQDIREYVKSLLEATDGKRIKSIGSKANESGTIIVTTYDGSTYEVKSSDMKGEMPKVGKLITDYITLKEDEDEKNSKEYKEYFQKKLDEYRVESPDELSDEDKKKFYEDADAGWKARKEEDKKALEEALKLPNVVSILEKSAKDIDIALNELSDELYNKRSMKNSMEKIQSSISYIVDNLKSGKYNS
jgi:hypothetical protein